MVRRAGSNSQGLEQTIRALADRIGDEDAALVALARGLAGAVDADPGSAALWREYRAAVTALMMVGTDDVDDDTAQFLLAIRTPVRTEVGNTEKSGTGNARPGNRRGGRPAGPAADAVATADSRRRK